MKKINKLVPFDPASFDRLQSLAARRGISQSEVVRQAVDKELSIEPQELSFEDLRRASRSLLHLGIISTAALTKLSGEHNDPVAYAKSVIDEHITSRFPQIEVTAHEYFNSEEVNE